MRVLFDYQAFTLQRHGGVSRYFAELVRQFDAGAAVEPLLGVRATANAHLGMLAPRGVRCVRTGGRPVDRLLTLLNRRESLRLLRRTSPDLFHPTYYRPYFLRDLGQVPFVLTVLDMIHELFAASLPAAERPVSDQKRLLAGRARRIIAISANTRRDLVRLWNIPEERIDVVPLATSLSPSPPHAALPAAPTPYILFVGTRTAYKNFDRFLRAVGPVLREDPALSLVCAGGGPLTARERSAIGGLGLAGQVHQMPADDAALAALYAHARLFAFPSLYEGFGLPLLEAFAGGCAVAASGGGSLPEVGGDGALYFDPLSESSIRTTVERLLRDETLRARLAEEGRRRLARYSWEKTASATLEVYRKAVGA